MRILLAAVIIPFGDSSLSQSLEPVPAFSNLAFAKPVDLQNAGDGTDRLFVVEQEGTIRVFSNDPSATFSELFLNIADSVHYLDGSEMGLLGLAFHPDYESNGYFYVCYTADAPLRSVVSRFSVSANPDSALRGSEQVLLEIPQPYTNHNGGQIAFGPDGYLYIGLGDGGSAGDPQNNAQTLSSLLGKILRIDVDSPGILPYGIPADNPFVQNGFGAREEIYAYGFRNPWRFSFDPVTGRLWCADVGQSFREEIDIVESGGNYGWNIMEGTACYPSTAGCSSAGLILPVWDYGRTFGGSITGGHVYRGSAVPSLTGRYVFGDFSSGILAALEYDEVNPPSVVVLDTLPAYALSSFGVDESGELYLCLISGSILRFSSTLVSVADQRTFLPSIALHPNYPNPFNGSTRLSFAIPVSGEATLTVFDVLGNEVALLFDGPSAPGFHGLSWDAGPLPSGTYFLELRVQSGPSIQRSVRTLLLLR